MSKNTEGVAKYGFEPRQNWIATEFGSAAGIAAASNIVFSNGLYDPWSSGGVNVTEAAAAAERMVSVGVDGSVKAVVLDHGAHHLDLMFANPEDTPDVLNARKIELAQIAAWTAAHYYKASSSA
jgi:lysosomal Pro-X carboxypeptidase